MMKLYSILLSATPDDFGWPFALVATALVIGCCYVLGKLIDNV
jgi:hypothetical protein